MARRCTERGGLRAADELQSLAEGLLNHQGSTGSFKKRHQNDEQQKNGER